MSILFVDQAEANKRLLPLTYTRPIADLRIGILTLAGKWSKWLDIPEYGFLTTNHLQGKFGSVNPDEQTIWIFNGVLPTHALAGEIRNLKPGEALYQSEQLLAARGAKNPAETDYIKIEFSDASVETIRHSWDIFRLNGQEIANDYELITRGRSSYPLNDPHTRTYGNDIFIEKGATVKAAILNAETGPIYLGKDSEVQEGAIIRGPFGMGEGSIVAMGAKVRGESSLGSFCKIGGEVSKSVLWGHSNKAHDGYLGNAVIGQWCNLGADTNNSNLKNNYDPVRMWDYETDRFIHTDLQFCGLIMGDHSKCAIGTLFNTGTTVGVASNIFGAGFPRTMIPSFSWGGSGGFVTHNPRKAFITANLVMKRRNLELSKEDKAILNHIFEASSQYRTWENE